MNRISNLDKFYDLNKRFIKGKISVKVYNRNFFILKNKFIKSMKGKDSCIVSDIEDWIQAYEPDLKIREIYEDYIDDEELRKGIIKIQKKIDAEIKELEKNETKR